VARAIHRCAAEDDEMRVGRGADRHPVNFDKVPGDEIEFITLPEQ
jgi:hypothetical protein